MEEDMDTMSTQVREEDYREGSNIRDDKWCEVHDLFSGLRGFTWDESTKCFTAEPEAWDDLIKAKPSAAKWRVNLIRYYDLIEEFWGVDCSIGHMARIACQARRNISTQSIRVDLNDDVNYIPEE
ncbi:hypothetical protein Fmac_000488 [Flemingia macrophylla]|uniref:Myb/SANT-like domain-containing protein n=1 Tax=Flemingia macrophylla TaxID=520843 RepID=A0ABD1NFZ3_9FABA